MTAAAAKNPAGVVGILNVAGGFRSDLPCGPDHLVKEFGIFARTARIPALWIYAENDRYFPPDLARRMFETYTKAGAPAQLQMLPPLGDDGHFVLSGSVDRWWPSVEPFLSGLHLPTSVAMQ